MNGCPGHESGRPGRLRDRQCLVPLTAKAVAHWKKVIRNSMGKEVERAQQAIDLAKTYHVAIVSGDDADVY
ncbi:MAG: hypothetical protein WCF90_09055 [Methanomicrobiales archaeon]